MSNRFWMVVYRHEAEVKTALFRGRSEGSVEKAMKDFAHHDIVCIDEIMPPAGDAVETARWIVVMDAALRLGDEGAMSPSFEKVLAQIYLQGYLRREKTLL